MSIYNLDPDQLKKIHLLSSLPRSELEKLVDVLQIREFPADSIVCYEGEPGDRMYLVLDGEIEIIKAAGTTEERVLGCILPGDYAGEMSLLERGGLRTATVRTVTPVLIAELTRLDFDNLIERWPGLALEMLRELSLRMRGSQTATIHDLQSKNQQLAKAYLELQAAQAQIIEKEKLERELQLAQQIQMSMLPSALPETRGYEFGTRILPARAVGGDLYDFIPLAEKGTIGVLIGDVSDKGIPAALFMALTRSLLRAEASLGLPPIEVIRQVNSHLLEMNKSNMFVTLIYGVLVPETGDFVFARAGHEVPILIDAVGNLESIGFSAGQLVGIFPDPLIDERCITIPPGGTVLLFTDGASDASNAASEFFGSERLESALVRFRSGSAQEICDRVFEEILAFQGDAPQIDDITLVVVKSHKTQ